MIAECSLQPLTTWEVIKVNTVDDIMGIIFSVVIRLKIGSLIPVKPVILFRTPLCTLMQNFKRN